MRPCVACHATKPSTPAHAGTTPRSACTAARVSAPPSDSGEAIGRSERCLRSRQCRARLQTSLGSDVRPRPAHTRGCQSGATRAAAQLPSPPFVSRRLYGNRNLCSLSPLWHRAVVSAGRDREHHDAEMSELSSAGRCVACDLPDGGQLGTRSGEAVQADRTGQIVSRPLRLAPVLRIDTYGSASTSTAVIAANPSQCS